MYLSQAFVEPERAGDTVHREEYLFCFPRLLLEQMLQIACRLMQVEHYCVVDHG